MRWVLLAAIVAVLANVYLVRLRRRRRMAAENAAFAAAHRGWEIFVSPVDGGLIAIDEAARGLILGSAAAWTRYALDDIVGVEIMRDGSTVAVASRGSPPAAVAPLASGPAARIRILEIEVIVDDPQFPAHHIQFFRSTSRKGVEAASPRLKSALESADKIQSLLVGALRDQRGLESLPIASSQEFARLRQLSEGTGPPLDEFLQRWGQGQTPSAKPPIAEGA